MSIQARPHRLQQGITIQRIGAEVLLYDEQRHRAFCLNPTSACVWELCDGTRTVAELADAATCALDAAVSEDIIQLALQDLRQDGLLAAEPQVAGPAPVSRRAMMQSLGASSLLLLPAIAAISAPKAAQAYGGCFDCTSAFTVQRKAAARAAAAQSNAENQRKLNNINTKKLSEQ